MTRPAGPHRPGRPGRPGHWRRPLWWACLGAVLLAHGLLADRLSAEFIRFGDGPPAMQKLQATYTRVLTPSAPPSPRPAPAVSPRRPAGGTPAKAAAETPAPGSAPEDAAAAPPDAAASEPAPDEARPADLAAAASAASAASATPSSAASATPLAKLLAGTDGALALSSPLLAATAASATTPLQPDQVHGPIAPPMALPLRAPGSGDPGPVPTASATPSTTATTAATATASSPAPTSAAAPAPTESLDGVAWPRSTRLRYRLDGWFRGEVQGQAQVEWLREGRRYQVHLEVAIGPGFAPIARRRMSSEGRITPEGLRPLRYEEETSQIVGRNRRQAVEFGPEQITLANGQQRPRPGDVQDTASQFVQVVFLFTRDPALAQPGRSLDFALALPNRLDRWTYDVVAREPLATPVGRLDTLHVKPRRQATADVMTVQMWLAPSLQMLPARIRIDQNAETWADLSLIEAPQQAER